MPAMIGESLRTRCPSCYTREDLYCTELRAPRRSEVHGQVSTRFRAVCLSASDRCRSAMVVAAK